MITWPAYDKPLIVSACRSTWVKEARILQRVKSKATIINDMMTGETMRMQKAIGITRLPETMNPKLLMTFSTY